MGCVNKQTYRSLHNPTVGRACRWPRLDLVTL